MLKLGLYFMGLLSIADSLKCYECDIIGIKEKIDVKLNDEITNKTDTDEGCPDGTSKVECIANPCESKTCSKYPNAICKPNYCGNCTADFHHEDKTPVDSCEEPECGEGEAIATCEENPCETATCLMFPKAYCSASKCGKCSAIFRDAKGNIIECGGACTKTVDCEESQICGSYNMEMISVSDGKSYEVKSNNMLCVERTWTKDHFINETNCEIARNKGEKLLKNSYAELENKTATYTTVDCGELEKCERNLCNGGEVKGSTFVCLLTIFLTLLPF